MLTKPLFWLLTQYLPPRAHVLRVPLILLPTFPGRQLSLQLPALHRRDALRSVTTPEFSTYPDRDRPTAPPRPSSRFRDDESVGTACSQNVHILEEQVRQLQSQLASLKIQAGPPKPNTAYKATPSEPFLDESEPREYGLHARTRLSIGFYRSA